MSMDTAVLVALIRLLREQLYAATQTLRALEKELEDQGVDHD